MVRPIADRPSTGYAAQYGITPPPGYKVNVNGEIVPLGWAEAAYDAGAAGPSQAGTGFAGGGSWGGLNVGVPGYTAPEGDPGGGYGYDSGYGSGGGGFVMPPPKALASSPEWLAYLNSLGLEEGQFRADIARQQGVLRTAADQQTGDLVPAGVIQRGGIAQNLAARGMSRSGEFLTRTANQRAGEGRAQAGIQTALAGQMSGLESQLAQKLIDIGARRASEELSLRSQGYV